MKLKNVQGIWVFANTEGKIALIEDSPESDKAVGIFLTLEQFGQVQRWVNDNQLEIEKLWNHGVEDA